MHRYLHKLTYWYVSNEAKPKNFHGNLDIGGYYLMQ